MYLYPSRSIRGSGKQIDVGLDTGGNTEFRTPLRREIIILIPPLIDFLYFNFFLTFFLKIKIFRSSVTKC